MKKWFASVFSKGNMGFALFICVVFIVMEATFLFKKWEGQTEDKEVQCKDK